MQPEDLQARWEAQGEDIFAAVAQWRAAHPHARLAEIEQAVDEQMHRLRARMLEEQNTQAQPLSTCPEEQASERMAMSSDGSMVPLVGGVWADARAGGNWRG